MTDRLEWEVEAVQRSGDGRAVGLREDLRAVCDTVRQLVRTGPRMRAIRLTAGRVNVEIDWLDESQEPTRQWPVDDVAADRAVAAGERAGAAAPVSVNGDGGAAEQLRQADVIHAPTLGVFYRAPEPGAQPFVTEGDMGAPGQQVGIVEAMKLMIPVESDRYGRVEEILVPDATPVEYGQPLLTLRPLDDR